MLSGILGLFVFIIFPVKLIAFLVKKVDKMGERTRAKKEEVKKRKQTEDETIRKQRWEQERLERKLAIKIKYEKMIQIAVEEYENFKKYNPKDICILSDKPVFIRDGRKIYIAFPAAAEEDTIHIFEEGYEKRVDDGKAPETFGYKNVKECDDNYAGLVENFEYALASLIGGITTSDESEITYEWLIICEYLYKAIGVVKWIGIGDPYR